MAKPTFKPSDKPDFGGSWEERYKIAESLEGFDFNCQFEGGLCVLAREGRADKVKCCCTLCAYGRGWFYDPVPTPDKGVARKIKQLFDEEMGFWRANKGCILPRKWRSRTCLFYACNGGDQARDVLYNIRTQGKVEGLKGGKIIVRAFRYGYGRIIQGSCKVCGSLHLTLRHGDFREARRPKRYVYCLTCRAEMAWDKVCRVKKTKGSK